MIELEVSLLTMEMLVNKNLLKTSDEDKEK